MGIIQRTTFFYTEGKRYDVCLILQGHREMVVPDTPDEYVKIYTSK